MKINLIISLFLVLSIVLGLVYLFQVESFIEASYLSQNYQDEINKLSDDNSFLEEKSNQEMSFEKTEEKAKKLGFVESREISYIPISPDYLAGKIAK